MDVQHGYGEIKYALTSLTYTGTFVNGRRHGCGTLFSLEYLTIARHTSNEEGQFEGNELADDFAYLQEEIAREREVVGGVITMDHALQILELESLVDLLMTGCGHFIGHWANGLLDGLGKIFLLSGEVSRK